MTRHEARELSSHAERFVPEKIDGDFFGKDFISVEQITSRGEVECLFRVAEVMRKSVEARRQRNDLRDKTVVELFYQPSTRTFASFLAAARWLGCQRVVAIPGMGAYSSAVKGESLPDTIRTIEETTAPDLIILRHPVDNSSEEAAFYAQAPVINAGSGKKEHPTQAILDLFTIYQELGKMDGLHVAMLGDLKYGRTVKSLAKLLAIVAKDTKISLVSPEILKMPWDLVRDLRMRGMEVYETENLDEILPAVDVLYVTRVQKEWFEAAGKMALYHKLKGAYEVTPETLKMAKEDMVVMHPFPRVGEIAYEVDSDPRAAYFRQMRNGLYTRMALLALILGKHDG